MTICLAIRTMVTVVACAAALSVIFRPAPAGAQRPMNTGLGVNDPTVNQDDLDDMTSVFQLDDMQAITIEALLEGYLAGFQEEFAEVHRRENEIKVDARVRQREDPTVWREASEQMRAIREDWHTRRETMEAAFFDSVRNILTPEQIERWPIFERERRRRMTLGFGARFSGEGVDLKQLVADAELTDEQKAQLASTLEEWAAVVDTALVARNNAIDESQRLLRAREVELGTSTFEAIDRRRIEIRDINRRFAEALASQLPVAEGERLRRRFLEESFHRIFQPTGADQFFERALALNDLTDAQRQSLESMRVGFERELEAISQRLVELERVRDEERARARTQSSTQRREDAAAWSSEARELWRERHRLMNETIDRAFGVLTPEQQLQAPKHAISQGSGLDDLEAKQFEDGEDR